MSVIKSLATVSKVEIMTAQMKMSGIIKNIFGRSILSVSNFSKPPQMAALFFSYLKPK